MTGEASPPEVLTFCGLFPGPGPPGLTRQPRPRLGRRLVRPARSVSGFHRPRGSRARQALTRPRGVGGAFPRGFQKGWGRAEGPWWEKMWKESRVAGTRGAGHGRKREQAAVRRRGAPMGSGLRDVSRGEPTWHGRRFRWPVRARRGPALGQSRWMGSGPGAGAAWE